MTAVGDFPCCAAPHRPGCRDAECSGCAVVFDSPEAESADQRARYLELQFDLARAAVDELVSAGGATVVEVLAALLVAYEDEAEAASHRDASERAS